MNEGMHKRLYRSRKDRVVGGVCGGLGGYLTVDPVIVRVVWLATVLLGGTGVLAYLIAWILIPESPEEVVDPGKKTRNMDGAKVVGVVLIVVALIWIGGRFGIDHMFILPWGWIAPITLVALGIALLIRPAAHHAAEEGHTEKTAISDQTETPEPEAADTSSEESDKSKEERPRQLRRSAKDRVLFGVCGGIAKHMNVDSTLVRLIFALATIFSAGLVIIIYLFLGLVLSEEESI
ncbi:MAG: PspC domain-containing protein [bacterium]